MKSRIKEQGSTAHIIIVVVVIVGIVSTLGFVLWQNFGKVPANDATESQVQTEADDSNTVLSVDFVAPLSIAQWGVKGDLGKNLVVNYTVNGDELRFTTNEVDCKEGLNGTGYITRRTASQPSPYPFDDGKTAVDIYDSTSATQARVGGYYYFYVAPSGICDIEQVEDYETVVEDLKAATQSFVGTLVQE